MALSDSKRIKYRGGGSVNWDALSRSDSKRALDMVFSHPAPKDYLDNISLVELDRIYRDTTAITRFGKLDWRRISDVIGDDKAELLVNKIDAYRDEQNKRAEEYSKERKVKEIEQLTAETEEFRKNAELTAGMLRSDFHDAVALRERYGQVNGDWLDDPVSAYVAGTGFAEEVRVSAGVKLQVTLSLDMSSSMWNNKIAGTAVKAYITIGLALHDLETEFPGSVFTESFLFAMDDGRRAMRIARYHKWWSNTPEDISLGDYESLRDSLHYSPSDAGEDTWIAPLFEEIEQWENDASDSGAVRLDVIITDGVLEHPHDIRSANKIQARRDGTLQTVFLNFLPEEDWHQVTLPTQCIQYPVHTDDVAGILRLILAEFCNVQM